MGLRRTYVSGTAEQPGKELAPRSCPETRGASRARGRKAAPGLWKQSLTGPTAGLGAPSSERAWRAPALLASGCKSPATLSRRASRCERGKPDAQSLCARGPRGDLPGRNESGRHRRTGHGAEAGAPGTFSRRPREGAGRVGSPEGAPRERSHTGSVPAPTPRAGTLCKHSQTGSVGSSPREGAPRQRSHTGRRGPRPQRAGSRAASRSWRGPPPREGTQRAQPHGVSRVPPGGRPASTAEGPAQPTGWGNCVRDSSSPPRAASQA